MKKAFLQLHIAVFLAGFTGVLGRLITLNPGLLVWYRLLFTSITMWLLFGWMKKLQVIPRKEIWKIVGVGLIAMLHWVTFYAAIKQSNVSVALVCFSSIGFFTALLEPLLLRKRVNKMELFLGTVIIGAIYLIFHFDTQYKTGIIIGIISAILGCMFPIFNRELLKKTNVETMLAWQQTGGLLGLSIALPFYLRYDKVETILPGWENFAWLLVLAWFCSVIAFRFSSNALKRLSAFTVNLTYNLEPVYGVILAFAIYHEDQYLSNWFFVGFVLIIATLAAHVLLLHRAEKKVKLNAAD